MGDICQLRLDRNSCRVCISNYQCLSGMETNPFDYTNFPSSHHTIYLAYQLSLAIA